MKMKEPEKIHPIYRGRGRFLRFERERQEIFQNWRKWFLVYIFVKIKKALEGPRVSPLDWAEEMKREDAKKSSMDENGNSDQIGT